MEPTIYKRPHIYKSNVYKRYGMNRGGIGVYKLPYGSPQGWTNTNVPVGVQTLHNFGDGAGQVPAIPYDNAGVTDTILDFSGRKLTLEDSAGVTDTILDFSGRKLTLEDSAGVTDTILDFEPYTN